MAKKKQSTSSSAERDVVLQTFTLPELGVAVEAADAIEAAKKAKGIKEQQ